MSEQDRNYEEEARASGWKPEEEWQGDPPRNGFKTAEDFVLDGERSAGILKGQRDTLTEELAEVKAQIASLLKSNEKLHEMSERQRQKAEAEKKDLLAQLEEQQARAIDDGDGKSFREASKQIDELKESTKQEDAPLSDTAAQWLGSNSWYGKDRRLTKFADLESDEVIAEGFMPDTKAYYDELTKRVKDQYPDSFGNKNREKPSSVEEGGSEKKSNGKTWDDLPKDAKAEFAQFAKDIPGFTKESYLSQYEWE